MMNEERKRDVRRQGNNKGLVVIAVASIARVYNIWQNRAWVRYVLDFVRSGLFGLWYFIRHYHQMTEARTVTIKAPGWQPIPEQCILLEQWIFRPRPRTGPLARRKEHRSVTR
jgi:hypothetical protein